MARVYVPLAITDLDREEDGLHLNLTFLGLGIYEDYYLRLLVGDQNVGSMLVESRFGTQAQYDLHFAEQAKDGRLVRNVTIAGFELEEEREASEELGWLNIGTKPVATSLAFDEGQMPRFSAVSDELRRLLEKKEMQRRLRAGTGPGE